MRRAAPLAIALVLAGCVTSRVTLLDNEGGNATGSLAIIAPDGSETVLDKANSEAALRVGNTRVRVVRQIKDGDRELFAYLPPPSMAFRIPYETNQSEVRLEQQAVLDQIRAELAKRPGVQIEVAAFTDSVGSESDNYQLSLDRARNVATALRQSGFEIAEEDAIGRGEYEALKAEGDDRDLPEYRRVDVIIR